MVVCGIDEVGRGPLAGPVCAAAVVFVRTPELSLLADSKVLSRNARNRAFAMINSCAQWSLGWASPSEIDQMNILQASLLAMERAFGSLQTLCTTRSIPVEEVLVDGNRAPRLSVATRPVIRGDQSIAEIQAASIVAKLARGTWMEAYDGTSPGYGFGQHKGYPTAEHRAAIDARGPDAIHRRSFRGVGPARTSAPPGGPVRN